MVVGVAYFSYTIGNIVQIINRYDSHNLEYEEKQRTLVNRKVQYGMNQQVFEKVQRYI